MSKKRRRRIMLMIYSENYELLQQLIDKHKQLSLRNSPSVLPTLEKLFATFVCRGGTKRQDSTKGVSRNLVGVSINHR